MTRCGQRTHKLCQIQSHSNVEDIYRSATTSLMHALRHRQTPHRRVAPVGAYVGMKHLPSNDIQ